LAVCISLKSKVVNQEGRRIDIIKVAIRLCYSQRQESRLIWQKRLHNGLMLIIVELGAIWAGILLKRVDTKISSKVLDKASVKMYNLTKQRGLLDRVVKIQVRLISLFEVIRDKIE
jgi:hypothetical protein